MRYASHQLFIISLLVIVLMGCDSNHDTPKPMANCLLSTINDKNNNLIYYFKYDDQARIIESGEEMSSLYSVFDYLDGKIIEKLYSGNSVFSNTTYYLDKSGLAVLSVENFNYNSDVDSTTYEYNYGYLEKTIKKKWQKTSAQNGVLKAKSTITYSYLSGNLEKISCSGSENFTEEYLYNDIDNNNDSSQKIFTENGHTNPYLHIFGKSSKKLISSFVFREGNTNDTYQLKYSFDNNQKVSQLVQIGDFDVTGKGSEFNMVYSCK